MIINSFFLSKDFPEKASLDNKPVQSKNFNYLFSNIIKVFKPDESPINPAELNTNIENPVIQSTSNALLLNISILSNEDIPVTNEKFGKTIGNFFKIDESRTTLEKKEGVGKDNSPDGQIPKYLNLTEEAFLTELKNIFNQIGCLTNTSSSIPEIRLITVDKVLNFNYNEQDLNQIEKVIAEQLKSDMGFGLLIKNGNKEIALDVESMGFRNVDSNFSLNEKSEIINNQASSLIFDKGSNSSISSLYYSQNVDENEISQQPSTSPTFSKSHEPVLQAYKTLTPTQILSNEKEYSAETSSEKSMAGGLSASLNKIKELKTAPDQLINLPDAHKKNKNDSDHRNTILSTKANNNQSEAHAPGQTKPIDGKRQTTNVSTETDYTVKQNGRTNLFRAEDPTTLLELSRKTNLQEFVLLSSKQLNTADKNLLLKMNFSDTYKLDKGVVYSDTYIPDTKRNVRTQQIDTDKVTYKPENVEIFNKIYKTRSVNQENDSLKEKIKTEISASKPLSVNSKLSTASNDKINDGKPDGIPNARNIQRTDTAPSSLKEKHIDYSSPAKSVKNNVQIDLDDRTAEKLSETKPTKILSDVRLRSSEVNSKRESELEVSNQFKVDLKNSTEKKVTDYERISKLLKTNNNHDTSEPQKTSLQPKKDEIKNQIAADIKTRDKENTSGIQNNEEKAFVLREAASPRMSEQQKYTIQNEKSVNIDLVDFNEHSPGEKSHQTQLGTQQSNNESTKGTSSKDEIYEKQNNTANESKEIIAGHKSLPENPKQNIVQTEKTFHYSEKTEKAKLFQPQEVLKEVYKIIEGSEKQTAILKLIPKELGAVKVVLDTIENSLVARIDVEHEHIATLIKNGVEQLKQSLTQNGVNVSSISIMLSSPEHKQSSNYNSKKKNNSVVYNKGLDKIEEKHNPRNLGYNTYEFLA